MTGEISGAGKKNQLVEGGGGDEEVFFQGLEQFLPALAVEEEAPSGELAALHQVPDENRLGHRSDPALQGEEEVATGGEVIEALAQGLGPLEKVEVGIGGVGEVFQTYPPALPPGLPAAETDRLHQAAVTPAENLPARLYDQVPDLEGGPVFFAARFGGGAAEDSDCFFRVAR